MTHHSFTPVHLACTCICVYLHADLSDVLSAMKLLTFIVSMCIVVYRRLLSTVMIARKFPNRSLFSLLIYSLHPSATPAFWWHETNFFLCLTTSALTHDVLQWVSFHPHSHCNLLRIAQRASATRYYWHILCVQKKWTGTSSIIDRE